MDIVILNYFFIIEYILKHIYKDEAVLKIDVRAIFYCI